MAYAEVADEASTAITSLMRSGQADWIGTYLAASTMRMTRTMMLDPPPRHQERADPGGDAGGAAGTDHRRRRGDHGAGW